MNEELETVIPERATKMDKFLLRLQEQIASGISAFAGQTNKFFSDPTEETNVLLLDQINAIKIMGDVFYSLSIHRRFLITPHLNPNIKKTCEESPVNKYLFGNELTARIKANQELKKFGSSLKRKSFPSSSHTEVSITPQKKQKVESASHLNFKRQASNFKKKKGRPTYTNRERDSYQSSTRSRRQ